MEKFIIYLNGTPVITFDNIEDAYNYTFLNECDAVEILGEGVFSVEGFQCYYSEL